MTVFTGPAANNICESNRNYFVFCYWLLTSRVRIGTRTCRHSYGGSGGHAMWQ